MEVSGLISMKYFGGNTYLSFFLNGKVKVVAMQVTKAHGVVEL